MINSDTPPKNVHGMLASIYEHAEEHNLTMNVLSHASDQEMTETQTMVCLAYAALCALETADKCIIDIVKHVGIKDDFTHDHIG